MIDVSLQTEAVYVPTAVISTLIMEMCTEPAGSPPGEQRVCVYVCECEMGGEEQRVILLMLQSNISLLANEQKHSKLLSFFFLFSPALKVYTVICTLSVSLLLGSYNLLKLHCLILIKCAVI